MKKTVKLLITAASVAAVVGVGAVSYAAWSAGSTSNAVVTTTTGSIVTLGTLNATSNIHGDNALALVPYNQQAQYDEDTMTKMADIQFTYDGAVGTVYKIALTNNAKNLTLKYQIGTSAPSTDNINTGWEAVPTSATQINITPETSHVYVILVSESDTQENDMNASFTITFSAEAPTVSNS